MPPSSGANPQAGNPSAAMAAAAAAMAAANDPAMANMAAAYAAAAANMPPPPHSGPHPGSGKTSPEPPMDASSHSNEERGRPGRGGGGGKDGGRRGRRGEGRESGGDDNGHSCPLLEQLKGNKVRFYQGRIDFLPPLLVPSREGALLMRYNYVSVTAGEEDRAAGHCWERHGVLHRPAREPLHPA